MSCGCPKFDVTQLPVSPLYAFEGARPTLISGIRVLSKPLAAVLPPLKSSVRQCPECGEEAKLYRTPRGLRCMDCVRKADSGGLDFRCPVKNHGTKKREPRPTDSLGQRSATLPKAERRRCTHARSHEDILAHVGRWQASL
jgi:hypothetical protein